MKFRCPSPAKLLGLKGTRTASVRLATTLATTLAAAVTLSGCQVMSPIQNTASYQLANGVAVDLGDVLIRDLVVVSGAKGEVGTLSGMVVNKGTAPVTITFATGATGGSATAQAPADSETRLSGVEGTEPVTLPNIAAAPGGIIKVTVSTPASGASEVPVPVLLPNGYYASITPAPDQTTAP
ncbi:MAG: hypothetical protein ACYCV4_10315 [Dermatophilaceae bacterium]